MFNHNEYNFEEFAERWSFPHIKSILENIEEKLNHTKVVEESTITFLLAASFSKALTTFEEIITLLYYGFPNGAFALSRNLYENFIITLFIYSYSEISPDMIQQFIDSFEFDLARINKLRFEDILKSMQGFETKFDNYETLYTDAVNAIKNADGNIEKFKKKYPAHKDNKDYWWTGQIVKNQTFKEMQDKLIEDENVPIMFRSFYKYACGIVHSGFLGIYGNLGDTSSDLVFSHAFDGYEIPLGFSLHVFMWYLRLFTKHFPHVALKPLTDELFLIGEKYVPLLLGLS